MPEGMVGTAYSASFAAINGRPPYVWSIQSAVPNTGGWMSINSSSGVLTGTPGTAEIENVAIKVSDTIGNFSVRNFSFTVDPLLQITSSSPLPAGTANQNYSFTLSATGGLGPYTWSLISAQHGQLDHPRPHNRPSQWFPRYRRG